MNSEQIPLLDHGYVQYLMHWGSEEFIIETARVSTQKGFKGWGGAQQCEYCGDGMRFARLECSASGGAHKWIAGTPGDEKLLRYLWEKKHSTPFEFAGFTIQIKAPIFVFREWHRHRTQSYSEASARYGPLPNENYTPAWERCIPKQTKNKQARGVSEIIPTEHSAKAWLNQLAGLYDHAELVYQSGLNTGIPKELARLAMNVGRYSTMRAATDLWNWMHFLDLRDAENVQWETREYAKVVGEIIQGCFPRTYSLFKEA